MRRAVPWHLAPTPRLKHNEYALIQATEPERFSCASPILRTSVRGRYAGANPNGLDFNNNSFVTGRSEPMWADKNLTVCLSLLLDSHRLWSCREPYGDAYHRSRHEQNDVRVWLHNPKANRSPDAGSANGEQLRPIRQSAFLDELPNRFTKLRVGVNPFLQLGCRPGEAERRQNPERDCG